MELIETVPVGVGGEASITFSAIPDTYTDLVLKLSARSSNSGGGVDISIKFNGNSANYSSRHLYGTGSSAQSGTTAYGTDEGYSLYWNSSSSTTSTFCNTEIYIPNYASSVAKSYSVDSVSENNATLAFEGILAGLWNDTTAITSVTIDSSSGGGFDFAEFSSASLYGILAGSDGTTTVA